MYTSVPAAVNLPAIFRRRGGSPAGAGVNFSPWDSVYAGGREVTSMAVRNRVESLTWGLFILALGVVLLIGNFRGWDFWYILKFWPVVLIIMGVNALIRYFSSRTTLPPEPPR
jgi:cell wall-active antibiotic response 4TMS protein YvqF